MSRPLDTNDISAIHALVELLSAAMEHELAIDDSEGVLHPKRIKLSNLAKLFVPFNGAVNDLDLGAHDLDVLRVFLASLHLSVTPATVPTDIGSIYWDTDALTIAVVLPNGVVMQVGEEMYVNVARDAGAPNPILNGMPVYTLGEQGQRPRVGIARADDLNKIRVTGIATHDIANLGKVTTLGLVRGIPFANVRTEGEYWLAGDKLWLAPTGGMTHNEPSAPTPNVQIGYIMNVTGSTKFDMLVFNRPARGMYDLYDVNGGAPADGNELSWDNALKYWKATNRLSTLEGNEATDGSVANSIKTAIYPMKGAGWTNENLVDHEARIAENESDIAQNTSDIGDLEIEVADLAGVGHTDETVYKNAQDIIALDARIVDAEAHVYGLDFNETTGVCTRLLDAVGLTVGAPDGVNPIVSDFDTCYPWSAMHHVKTALDGTRKEPFEDGYDTFDGEMMRHTPAYWYKDYRSGGHRYLYISDKKKAGFLYQKAYDIASFDASKVGTEYRSRVGEAPKTNESYTQFITGFYAQGDGRWSMYDQLHSEFMLSVIEAGTLNHKAAYGRGINSGMPYGSTAVYLLTADTVAGNDVVLADSAQPFYVGMTVQIGTANTNNSVAQNRMITNVVRAGGVLTLTLDGAPFSAVIGNSCVTWGQSVPQAQFDTIGDGSGYILQHESVNRSHVCYRGVWDLWGNVWQFYAGFMRYNGRYYGCTDPTKYNITNLVGADGWIDLGLGEYAENGYQQIREGVVIDGGTIDVPRLWGSVANSETYYSAYLYNFSSAYTGTRVLLLGGYWGDVGSVSLVFSDGGLSPSSSYFSIGSRLIRS